MLPCRMLLLAALIATACASCAGGPESREVIRNVEIARPAPEAARRACPAPVTLPDRALNAGEVTSFWGRDRAALVECEARRRAAVEGRD